MSTQNSTKELKRVLGRMDLFSIAIGQMVGAGIMTLVGFAIAQTGRSVNLAFLLSAVLICAMYIPNIIIGGTARLRGGRYTQTALFAGRHAAGIFLIFYIASNIMVAMYAMSFAQYFQSIVPSANPTIVAVVILTVFFVLNIFGVKGAAKVQTLLMFFLIAALLLFTFMGFPNIQPGYFEAPGFLTNGIKGLLGAGALLTFALAGGDVIVQLGGEAKNPTKDIPFVLIVSTVTMAVLYAIMSTVAAGVLPLDQVAGEPLSVVAAAFMSGGMFTFFVVGGGLFALATTLNATFGWITKPLLQACDDGWFPKKLSYLHPTYKTPVYLLVLTYIVGLLPVLFQMELGDLSMAVLIFYYASVFITAVSVYRAPIVMPELWSKSKFKVSTPVLMLFSAISSLSIIVQVVLLFDMISSSGKVLIVVIAVLSVVFAFLRAPKVAIVQSHEEDIQE